MKAMKGSTQNKPHTAGMSGSGRNDSRQARLARARRRQEQGAAPDRAVVVDTVTAATPEPEEVSFLTPRFLLSAALIVSHCSALGALEGCSFGVSDSGGLSTGDDLSWGNPVRISEHLSGIYDTPQAVRLLDLIRQASKTPELNPDFPGIGFGGLWPPVHGLIVGTSFPLRPTLTCTAMGLASGFPQDDHVVGQTFRRLIALARDWMQTHRCSDGLGEWPVCNVARSAEFAFLLLEALAKVSPGEHLDLPGMPGTEPSAQAERASRVRRTAALGLTGLPAFTALEMSERQRLSELLLLMPTFLGAVYEYSRLTDDSESQELVSELANDGLGTFFGVPPLRTEFTALSHFDFGPL